MVLPPLIALPNNLLYSGKLFNDRIQPLKDFGNYLKLNEKTIIILSADTQGYRGALIPFYFNAKISCSDPGDNLPILCANDENKKNSTMLEVCIDFHVVLIVLLNILSIVSN